MDPNFDFGIDELVRSLDRCSAFEASSWTAVGIVDTAAADCSSGTGCFVVVVLDQSNLQVDFELDDLGSLDLACEVNRQVEERSKA